MTSSGESPATRILTAPAAPAPYTRGRRAPILSAAASALTAALIVSLFALILTNRHAPGKTGLAATPLPSPICTPAKAPPAQRLQATHQGITVTYADAVATPTHTSVQVHITALDGQVYSSSGVSLSDACGFSYQSEGGMGGSNSPGSLEEMNVFNAFPAATAGQPQWVTLTVSAVSDIRPGHGTSITGPWQIVFPLTLQSSGSRDLHLTGDTQGKVTVIPTHIDWLNMTTPLDHVRGGVRIHLHITGLPPATDATREEIGAKIAYNYDGGSIGDASPADVKTRVFVPGDKNGHVLSLLSPTNLRYGIVGWEDWQSYVSASGEADIDLAFFDVQLPAKGTLTLRLDDGIGFTYAQVDAAGQPIAATMHDVSVGQGMVFQIPLG